MSTTTNTTTTPEPGPLTKEIAGLIKGRMARFDVKQGEMAAQVGVVQSQMSKMLRGKRAINIDQLEIMCHVLGIEVSTLVDDADTAVTNRADWLPYEALVVENYRER